ncbi:MAG TPA: prolipoprotein diacylglyceryl transferase [Gemmatimonadales bacterium]|nr:prolipoprotein diacylglyceryl transferase [Gemmatimonadales bacterium]
MTVYPLLIHLGRFTLTGYGIMMMLGFLVAGWIYGRELQRRSLDPAVAWDTVVIAVVGGLVGSKLYFAISVGRIAAAFSRGGLVWYGGLIGGAGAVFAYMWLKRLPIRSCLDAVSPSLVVGYMLGRVGCFMVNDDYGLPSRLPWAVAFPEGSPPTTARILSEQFHAALPKGVMPDQVLTVHPTQLYEIALSFVVFWLLWRRREHRHAAGWLFAVYLVLSSLERITVEIFRAKDDRILGAITVAQLLSAGLLMIGLLLMWRLARPETEGPQPTLVTGPQ